MTMSTILKTVEFAIRLHVTAGTSPSVPVAAANMEMVAANLPAIDTELAYWGYERDLSRDNPERAITGGIAGMKPDMSVNSGAQGAIFIKKI
jgi:hypothetical protein